MVQPNTPRYLRSLGDELSVQSNRVRDLIGDAHWFLDGNHREFLLTALLRRHAPASILVTRGFVVAGTSAHERSKEQDILLVDEEEEAPMFNQGGMVVVSPRAVIGAISVKTKLAKAEFVDAHHGLESLKQVFRDLGMAEPWCGSFFYELSNEVDNNLNLVYEYIAEVLPPAKDRQAERLYGAELVCTANDLAVRTGWFHHAGTEAQSYRASAYACDGHGTGILIAGALAAIAAARKRASPAFSDLVASSAVQPIATPFRDFT